MLLRGCQEAESKDVPEGWVIGTEGCGSREKGKER